VSLKALGVALLLAICPVVAGAQGASPRYGANAAAGQTFTHDGVSLYYEVYGAGDPLLIVHGNGASIGSLKAQIDYFRTRYRVLVMDSRDHGRSGTAAGPLNFEQMADDLAALLEREHAAPAYVLGWSDGGIEALVLGMRHPQAVKKIASMAANLEPSDKAVYAAAISPPPAPDKVNAILEGGNAAAIRKYRTDQLDRDHPHIPPAALEAIKAPTLVLAADHDLIRDEHTVEIFHHLPNSQLAIFPNATHMIPYDDPATFNATVDRFFSTPFVKRDRLGDVMKSIGKIRVEMAKPQ
jgi:pimeloyl-ACP methyl ester carboxylesterase